MSTLRRQLANRRNSALSTGPVTPEGKRRSSLNAIRHGLLAACVTLPDESREAFDTFLAEFLEEFQPTPTEFLMIEEMLAAMWRQRRAWAIENRLLASAMAETSGPDPLARLTSAFSTLSFQPQLNLIYRYESRFHRIFERALNNLLRIRKQRDRREKKSSILPNEANASIVENLND